MAGFDWRAALRAGVVIPAHPLALTAARKLGERRQRAPTAYSLAGRGRGASRGGHTTQFSIREHGHDQPVLERAAEETRGHNVGPSSGVCGTRRQAIAEAECAA